MPSRQVQLPVAKFRAGRRTRVRLLVLHTTEGARTMGSLAAFLRQGPQASYHAGTDDQVLGYLVDRSNEAWHCRGANPMSDGFVFCGFARWSRTEWLAHPVMLDNAAWWLASCARDRGVPLRWLSTAEVAAAVRDPRHPGGVCDHNDYSEATGDGTHWDCGPGLPKDWLIDHARAQAQGDDDMTPEQAAQLATVHREVTQRLPSRSEYAKPPWADTLLGTALNAEGRAHEAIIELRALVAALPRVIRAEVRAALAEEHKP